MQDKLTEESVLAAYRSVPETLTTAIFDRHSATDNEDSLLAICVRLHNAGDIDLLALAHEPAFAEMTGFRFFQGQQFFCAAIPKLNATPTEMMRFVLRLVEKGGTDLAANQPNGAFLEWCRVDLSRSKEVIEQAALGDALAIKFVTFALRAGDLKAEAERFINDYDDERRVSAVVALGRMNFVGVKAAKRALAAIQRAIETGSAGDVLLGNALAAAYDVVSRTKGLTSRDASMITAIACKAGGAQTLYCCASAIAWHAKIIDESSLRTMLSALANIDVTQKGTINTLDHALGRLSESPYFDIAIEFAKTLLIANAEQLRFAELDGFAAELLKSDRFASTFVDWMLSGERVLCEGLQALLRHHEGPLKLELNLLKLGDIDLFFLCRKAVGYLFLQSVIVASVIVAALRACTPKVVPDLCNLLVDPVLQNYGGAVRDYLATIRNGDRAFRPVRKALQVNRAYVRGLRSVGSIPEIHPSERQRQIEHLRFQDDMRQAHTEAEKDSIFLNLVRRSVILYGKRSLTYFTPPGEKASPVTMELKAHSVTMEVPRVQMVDPVGLDYLLRIFRVERLAR